MVSMPAAIPVDSTWSALATSEGEPRRREMEDRFAQLAVLGETERVDAIEGMLRAEFTLSEQDLHSFTEDRFRAWIALDGRDPAQAGLAVRGYDAAMERLPADMAMRRASVTQGVAREMTAADIAALHKFVPSLRQSVPLAAVGVQEDRAHVEAARDRTAARNARPFWKLWG